MQTKVKNLSNFICAFIEDYLIFYCSFRFVLERMLPIQNAKFTASWL